MTMSQDLYHALNRAFDAVRTAEQEASRLEAEAREARDRGIKAQQELYDLLNKASVSLRNNKGGGDEN